MYAWRMDQDCAVCSNPCTSMTYGDAVWKYRARRISHMLHMLHYHNVVGPRILNYSTW